MYQQTPAAPGQPGKKQANRVTLALNGFRVSVKARLFFPHLFQPKQEANKAPKFSCMIMWPINDPVNAEAVRTIEAKLAEIKNTFHPHIHEMLWANPLKDFYTSKRQDGKPWAEMYKDMKWINCSNSVKFAPDIRVKNPDGSVRKASAADEILAYDGADILVSLSFFGLDGENQGKYGVSTNFDVVILLGSGEKVHIASGVDVNQAFGQFASMMGLNLQAPASAPAPAPAPHQAPAQQYQQPAPQQAPAQQYQQPAPQQAPAQQNYYQQPAPQHYEQQPAPHQAPAQQPQQQPYNPAQPPFNNFGNGQGLV